MLVTCLGKDRITQKQPMCKQNDCPYCGPLKRKLHLEHIAKIIKKLDERGSYLYLTAIPRAEAEKNKWYRILYKKGARYFSIKDGETFYIFSTKFVDERSEQLTAEEASRVVDFIINHVTDKGVRYDYCEFWRRPKFEKWWLHVSTTISHNAMLNALTEYGFEVSKKIINRTTYLYGINQMHRFRDVLELSQKTSSIKENSKRNHSESVPITSPNSSLQCLLIS